MKLCRIMLALTLILALIPCSAAMSGDDLTGRWTGTADGDVSVLLLKNDGSFIMLLDEGVEAALDTGTWSVQPGILQLVLPDDSFVDLHYTLEGDMLSARGEGETMWLDLSREPWQPPQGTAGEWEGKDEVGAFLLALRPDNSFAFDYLSGEAIGSGNFAEYKGDLYLVFSDDTYLVMGFALSGDGMTITNRFTGDVYPMILRQAFISPSAQADAAMDWFVKIQEAVQEQTKDDPTTPPTAAPTPELTLPNFGSRDLPKAYVQNTILATGNVLTENGFEFILSTSLGYAVITKYTGSGEVLAVPSMLNGFPVEYIGDGAFNNCYSIKGISLPDTLVGIGNYVFLACVNLEEVIIPDSVLDTGVGLFGICRSLQRVVFPPRLAVIKAFMFQGCTSLEEVTVPPGVLSIEEEAFAYSPQLTFRVWEDSYAHQYAIDSGIPFTIITDNGNPS